MVHGGTCMRACGHVSATCVCSECATVTARVCTLMQVCAHGWVLTRSAVLAARGAWWDTGGAAAPRTCAVPLSPVRGAAGGNAAGRGNNAASCTAGNSPKGGQGLGGGRGRGHAAQRPSCPQGMGHVALLGCPGGVAVPCISVSPQQRQTHARTNRVHVPSSAGVWAQACNSSTRAGGGTGTGGTPVALSCTPVHVQGLVRCVSARPPFTPLTPGHRGLHARTLPGTLAPGGHVSCTWVCAQVPHACAHGTVPCCCHPECACACARCGHPCVRVHVPAACAPCQGAPCPAAWGATPRPALHVGCPWAAPWQCPLSCPR